MGTSATGDPTYVRGVHYTGHVERIKDLKRAQRADKAIALLLECLDATEAEANIKGGGVAPWYYEQLAILYRKDKRLADEIDVLERYERQSKAAGVGPAKLAARLARARELSGKN